MNLINGLWKEGFLEEVVLKYAFILTNVCLIELLRRKQYQI